LLLFDMMARLSIYEISNLLLLNYQFIYCCKLLLLVNFETK
jgi:hypothetical protein